MAYGWVGKRDENKAKEIETLVEKLMKARDKKKAKEKKKQ